MQPHVVDHGPLRSSRPLCGPHYTLRSRGFAVDSQFNTPLNDATKKWGPGSLLMRLDRERSIFIIKETTNILVILG